MTIYGDYTAEAVSGGGRAWHIQGSEPRVALCGKILIGDLSTMTMHVRYLECSTCMRLGGERAKDADYFDPNPTKEADRG